MSSYKNMRTGEWKSEEEMKEHCHQHRIEQKGEIEDENLNSKEFSFCDWLLSVMNNEKCGCGDDDCVDNYYVEL